MAQASDTVHADASHFRDERGSGAALAPNGENPSKIMTKAVMDRIVDCQYYKSQCFAVNEADIIDRVVEHVEYIAGTEGMAQTPSPFLCLAFKLLELGPNDEIIEAYLNMGGEHFKYLRALAVFYVRMTRTSKNVYLLLEPFLADKRKLRRKKRTTGTSLTFMDDFVDELLTKERVCATSLKLLTKREILEELEELDPRVSPLGDIDDLLEASDGEQTNGERVNGDVSEGEIEVKEEMDVDDERPRTRSRSP